jgi:hypothetical protein
LAWRADREAAWRSRFAERFYLASDYQPATWLDAVHMPRWAARLTLEISRVRVEQCPTRDGRGASQKRWMWLVNFTVVS